MGTEKFIAFKEDGSAYRLKGRILRFLDNEPVSEADKTNIRSTLSVPASAEGLTPANNLSDLDSAATARTNLSVNSIDEDAEATATKLLGPALYFDGSNDYLEVSDDSKLTFSSSAEFGTNSSGTWSPDDNSPALTDGTGTLNQHYRVDSGAGTVTQGGSTLSIINGTATTDGQAVYYDGSVWRLKDVDDLPFSVSGWIQASELTSAPILCKFNAASTGEWSLETDSNDKLRIYLNTSSGNNFVRSTSTALTAYEGKWIHVAASYAGAGPSAASGNAFSSAGDGITIYINGEAVAMSAAVQTGTYAGMTNGTDTVRVGRQTSQYYKGHIKDVKIFNRELTADEVAQLARGTDLGYADQYAGALGGVYSSDFTSDSTDSWSAGANIGLVATDTVGGDSDNLKLVANGGTGTHYAAKALVFTVGKRYRISAEYYIPSGQSNIDGISLGTGASGSDFAVEASATLDAWTPITAEAVAPNTAFRVYGLDGGAFSFTDSGSDDYVALRNIKITEIGTLADFRAENYDSDTGKIYDISDNAFVGTSANLPTLTGRAYPVYETGTWTPSLTGSTTTDFSYTTQEGYYTRTGNTVFIRGTIIVSALGTSAGNIEVAGLPFTSSSDGASSSVLGVYALNMASLTSQVIGLVGDGTTTIGLLDSGASGVTQVTVSNLTATSTIKFSGTYQIQ